MPTIPRVDSLAVGAPILVCRIMSTTFLVTTGGTCAELRLEAMVGLETCKLEMRDSFCIQLLIEEGLLIGRMLDQFQCYTASAAGLTLTALPLLAVAEHDAIPFLNKKFDVGLSAEDPRITTIRHMTKSLDSKNVDYNVYSEEARAIIQALDEQFYSSTTMLDSLFGPFQTNVGISYYQGIPIYANYSTLHILTKGEPSLMQRPGHVFEMKVGYEAGASGAVIYGIAQKYLPNHENYRTEEFKVQANGWRYEQLVLPLKSGGVEDEAAFFFFSELLMLLTSVVALREAGFLEDAVWLKYSSLTLDHAWRAIGSFSAYARKGKGVAHIPLAFLDEVGHLLSRDEAKFIKRSRRLRNAMMHYDFKEDLVPNVVDGSNPWAVMDAAAMRVHEVSAREFGDELFRVRDKLVFKIAELIGFPDYSPKKSPWGWN